MLATLDAETLSPEMLQQIDAYWRAANYLSVGQISLYDNPLLKRPLRGMGRVFRMQFSLDDFQFVERF